MIIVVHNECHFYSNVLDYLNNFIIITISQDNYFRPPPPLIEKSFLDDVSDISDWEVQDMPGAQAEEPAAKEERSEPVQVGGGAFLGKDDLEDISDEEVDWSNDGENIMIVEESIDEELSNCEFTNEREVVEKPTVFDRLGHRSPVVKRQPVTIKDRLGGREETSVTMEPVTVKLRLGSPSKGSKGSLRGALSCGNRGSPSRCSSGSLFPRRSESRPTNSFRRSSRSKEASLEKLARRSLSQEPSSRKDSRDSRGRDFREEHNRTTFQSGGSRRVSYPRRSLRGSPSRGSRGSIRASSSWGSRGSPSRSSRGSLSPWWSDSKKKKASKHVDLSSEAGEAELRKLANQEVFVEEGQLMLENEGGQWMLSCCNMDLDTPEALRSPTRLGEEEKGNNQVTICHLF